MCFTQSGIRDRPNDRQIFVAWIIVRERDWLNGKPPRSSDSKKTVACRFLFRKPMRTACGTTRSHQRRRRASECSATTEISRTSPASGALFIVEMLLFRKSAGCTSPAKFDKSGVDWHRLVSKHCFHMVSEVGFCRSFPMNRICNSCDITIADTQLNRQVSA